MQINTSSVPLTGNAASVCFCSHPGVGNTGKAHGAAGRRCLHEHSRANFKRAHNSLSVWGVCGVVGTHSTDGWVAFERTQAA